MQHILIGKVEGRRAPERLLVNTGNVIYTESAAFDPGAALCQGCQEEIFYRRAMVH